MTINISSDGKKVLDSGLVFAFNETSDFKFEFKDIGLKLNIRFIFDKDNSKQQTILVSKNADETEFKCMNFSDSGTGTSKPITLGKVGKSTVYMNFWSYLDGDMAGTNKTRKIEYTIYQEKENGK